MKITVEVDENLTENEIVIRCSEFNEDMQSIQRTLLGITKEVKTLVFYKGEKEYYLPIDKILFFETEDKIINAHTVKDVYQTKYKLYELEEILPTYFIRVSKSTILNLRKVYSISRNLSSASLVMFQNTHKQVYVSRRYYKNLKEQLEEKRVR